MAPRKFSCFFISAAENFERDPHCLDTLDYFDQFFLVSFRQRIEHLRFIPDLNQPLEHYLVELLGLVFALRHVLKIVFIKIFHEDVAPEVWRHPELHVGRFLSSSFEVYSQPIGVVLVPEMIEMNWGRGVR